MSLRSRRNRSVILAAFISTILAGCVSLASEMDRATEQGRTEPGPTTETERTLTGSASLDGTSLARGHGFRICRDEPKDSSHYAFLHYTVTVISANEGRVDVDVSWNIGIGEARTPLIRSGIVTGGGMPPVHETTNGDWCTGNLALLIKPSRFTGPVLVGWTIELDDDDAWFAQ